MCRDGLGHLAPTVEGVSLLLGSIGCHNCRAIRKRLRRDHHITNLEGNKILVDGERAINGHIPCRHSSGKSAPSTEGVALSGLDNDTLDLTLVEHTHSFVFNAIYYIDQVICIRRKPGCQSYMLLGIERIGGICTTVRPLFEVVSLIGDGFQCHPIPFDEDATSFYRASFGGLHLYGVARDYLQASLYGINLCCSRSVYSQTNVAK